MINNFNKSLFLLAFSTALGGVTLNEAKAEVDIDTIITNLAPNSITNITKLDTPPVKCDATTNCFKFANGTDETGAPVYAYYSYEKSTAEGHYEDSPALYIGSERAVEGKRFIGAVRYPYGEGRAYGSIENEAGITTLTSDFINNYTKTTNAGWVANKGGAIYSYNTISTLTGDFIGNYAYSESGTAESGAIYNSSTITTITGNFIGNYAKTESSGAGAGVINNDFAGIGTITGNFIGNYVEGGFEAEGGVIKNVGSQARIENINSNFVNNYVKADGYVYGGVIYNNSDARIDAIRGDFIGNYAEGTSAIGGAIYTDSRIDLINSNFVSNHVKSETGTASGGAIYSSSSTTITLAGTFNENYAESESGAASGGAIYLSGTPIENLINSFTGNYVYSKYGKAEGGAVYISPSGSTSNIDLGSSSFFNNYAKSETGVARGGAMYLAGKSFFISSDDENQVVFKGNYVQTGSASEQYEAIYLSHNQPYGPPAPDGSLTFTSNNGGTFTFYDYINGDNSATINFVSDNDGAEKTGAIFYLYNDIKGQKNINFQNKYVLDMISPNDIHKGTSALSVIKATNITISDAIQMAVDVDLATGTMDHFEATNFTIASGGSLNVTTFNIVTEDAEAVVGDSAIIPFIIAGNSPDLSAVSYVAEAIGSEYNYDVQFNATTGKFEFIKKAKASPAPGRTAVVKTIGAAAGATTSMVGGLGGQTMGHGMNTLFSGMNSGDEPLGLTAWVEAFGSNDDVELKHMSSKVDTQFYGLVGGIDSKRFTYDNGLNAVYGVYGAYVQGKQKLDDTKITQKSGYLGLSAALRKEALFSNFSLTGGYVANEANTPWGKDKFDTKVITLATKTGVDVKKDAWTITPSLLLSYTGLDTDDYTAKSGTKVENKFMNVFTVAPELKVAKDFGEGLNGYAKVAYKMFFYDNNKIEADDVLMPAMSVKPYVEYGVGATKTWSDDMATFAEINRHDGGRTGWDLNLGLKLDF